MRLWLQSKILVWYDCINSTLNRIIYQLLLFSINTYSSSSKRTIISTEKTQYILVEISLFLTFVKISRSSVKNAQNRYIGITSKLVCSLFGNKTKAVDFHSGQWGFRECCTDQIISSWLLVLWYENLTRKIIACAARYKRPINPMLKKIQMDTSDLCLK